MRPGEQPDFWEFCPGGKDLRGQRTGSTVRYFQPPRATDLAAEFSMRNGRKAGLGKEGREMGSGEPAGISGDQSVKKDDELEAAVRRTRSSRHSHGDMDGRAKQGAAEGAVCETKTPDFI